MTTAAEDIFLAYYAKVSAYIRGRVDNHHDAEDLTAHVFEKVYSKLHTFDETKASLPTWIYTITRNAVTDYYRTRRIHASYDEAYELPAPEQDRDALDTLADALMTLKVRERDLIPFVVVTIAGVVDNIGDFSACQSADDPNLKSRTGGLLKAASGATLWARLCPVCWAAPSSPLPLPTLASQVPAELPAAWWPMWQASC